jgi:hypothetical protein
MYLAEAIQDMMMMWLVNNRQFLFLNQDKQEYILRIIGNDLFGYFKRAGLDEMTVTPEAMQMVGDVITGQEGNVSDGDMMQLYESAKTPKFPVFSNPKEKNPEKLAYKSKMEVNDMGDGAELTLVPEDLEGNYDYIADVQSMQAGASDQLMKAQQEALAMLTTNPVVLQLLQMQGVTPQIKEILIDTFNQTGLKDAEKYFQTNQQQGVPAQGSVIGGDGLTQPMGVQGVPGQVAPPPQAGQPANMAGPQQVPQPGGFPAGL